MIFLAIGIGVFLYFVLPLGGMPQNVAAYVAVFGAVVVAIVLRLAKMIRVSDQRIAAEAKEQEEAAAKEAAEEEERRKAAEARLARFNEYQYTYEGILQRGHYSLIDYNGRSEAAQDWMATLSVGQEVELVYNDDADKYQIDGTVQAPQRMVDIMENKEICRFYVHKIEETQTGKLSVQFIAAYDVYDAETLDRVKRDDLNRQA